MPRIDSAPTTLLVAALLAIGTAAAVNFVQTGGLDTVANLTRTEAADEAVAAAPKSAWATTAPGRVEPSGGEIRIVAETGGRVVETYVNPGDEVRASELLLRLKDDEQLARLRAARTEVGVRKREREEEATAKPAEARVAAEDALADAERARFDALAAFDAATIALHRGAGDVAAVDAAAAAFAEADKSLSTRRSEVASILADPETPLPTRLESSLETARAELRLAEIALERTRVRAPGQGHVLAVPVKAGETVVPSPEMAVIRFGDLTGLSVKAEIDERDAGEVQVGQEVVVRSPAFPDRDFTGKVKEIATSLAAPRLAGRGPSKPLDIEVLEVTIAVDGKPPLLTGMRVDVFFKQSAAARSTAAASPTK